MSSGELFENNDCQAVSSRLGPANPNPVCKGSRDCRTEMHTNVMMSARPCPLGPWIAWGSHGWPAGPWPTYIA